MVEFIGLIKVNVVRGTNLAVRDMVTSDPYVILSLGNQVILCSPIYTFPYNEGSDIYKIFYITNRVYLADSEDTSNKK